MKSLIFAFVFCCLGFVVTTPVVPDVQPTLPVEQSTEDSLTANVMTEHINTNSNVSQYTPAPSFVSGVVSAFTVIIVSELGDKTFFIAVVLSLTCSPLCVFGGAISALIVMTLLSAGLGLVTSVIPRFWVLCVSALLFIIFGLKMLREAYLMKSTACEEELEDVQKDVNSKMASKTKMVDAESGTTRTALRWVFLEAFVMTFLAEWGDRSQITTFVLAAKDNIFGVIVGTIVAHALCTLLAVLGGKFVAAKISLKIVTLIGAILFFIFAIISIVHAVQAYLHPSSS